MKPAYSAPSAVATIAMGGTRSPPSRCRIKGSRSCRVCGSRQGKRHKAAVSIKPNQQQQHFRAPLSHSPACIPRVCQCRRSQGLSVQAWHWPAQHLPRQVQSSVVAGVQPCSCWPRSNTFKLNHEKPPCTYRQLLNALHFAVIKDDGETCRTTRHHVTRQLPSLPSLPAAGTCDTRYTVDSKPCTQAESHAAAEADRVGPAGLTPSFISHTMGACCVHLHFYGCLLCSPAVAMATLMVAK